MHLWRYVGWPMGVHEDFLVESERERHRIDYHVLAAQAERRYPSWPAPLQGLRARYERERLLSMLTVFLGPESMRELGLPMRPPWAHAYIFALNTLSYRVLGRLPGGKGRLWRWGGRRAQWLLDSYFQGDGEDVGQLEV